MEVQVADGIKIERDPDPPKLTKTQLAKLEKETKRKQEIAKGEAEVLSINQEFDDYMTNITDQKQEAGENETDAVGLLKKELERLTERLDMLEQRMSMTGAKYNIIFN